MMLNLIDLKYVGLFLRHPESSWWFIGWIRSLISSVLIFEEVFLRPPACLHECHDLMRKRCCAACLCTPSPARSFRAVIGVFGKWPRVIDFKGNVRLLLGEIRDAEQGRIVLGAVRSSTAADSCLSSRHLSLCTEMRFAKGPLGMAIPFDFCRCQFIFCSSETWKHTPWA